MTTTTSDAATTGRMPPGPSGPAAYHTLEFMLRPTRFVERMRRRYGDVFRVRALGLTGLGVCSPELAKEVFATDPDEYAAFSRGLKGVVGHASLFATSGAEHRRQRKLLNPPFHGQRTREFAKTMRDVARAHFARLRPGDRVAMLDVGQAISLDVILETVFASGGVDRERVREILRSLLDGFSPLAVFSPALQTPLFPPWRRFLEHRAAFDAFVTETLRARRASSQPGDDILGLLLEARYDDGGALSDEEIHDHLITLLIAGHETTAIAIAWGAYWLCREPRVTARLREEISGLGPDPAPDALTRLAYLGAVCDEVLRIRPIVTDVLRPVKRDLRIGQWTVPAGETIVVFLEAMLRDPAIFERPEEFRPERFVGRRYTASELLPFGGGHRRCLGAAFAEQELRIVLGTLVMELELELESRAPERSKRRNVTMGPARGVRVVVRDRV
ncbi:MAG TPA: cytochrome P450 [Polyangiaceae bacterium]|nr:cytochrome P450 [Polyangiaceae bacterium]